MPTETQLPPSADEALPSPSGTTPSLRRSRTGRPRVLLTTEGTYPHFRGGVSTWCDFLIRGADDVDFVVWTLMMNPFIKQQYDFPDNVDNFLGVPLWGVEQPAEYTREIPSAKVFEASRRTREADIERHFLPLFNRFMDSITAPLFDPQGFADVLLEMHVYFREWEYRTTWRSRVVWDAFKERLMAHAGGDASEVPATEREPTDEGLVPNWGSMRDSFRSLVGRDGSRNGSIPRPEERDVEDVPTVGEAVEGMRWLYRLLQTLNVEVPDTDVTHSAAAAFCAIPCILAKAERGTPFLLTEHGVYLREQYLNIERRRFPYNFKRFLIDLVSAVVQTAYAMADQVSPVCEFNTRWELAYGTTQDRIRVIYNGVSPEKYRPIEVDRPSTPTVVQVGRIDPLKDVETFLRVADRVRRDVPDVRFVHYGPISDDEYWDDVKEIHRELRLGDTVEFRGFTSEVTRAYNEGDVVLLTSISEAFPYSVVEALMCGRPVVSTAVGGVKEALDTNGMTAPTRDVEGLAEAVMHMLRLTPEERERMSRQARQRSLENFTLDKFIGEYRETYVELASRERSTGLPAALPAPEETTRAPVTEEAPGPEPETTPVTDPRAPTPEPAATERLAPGDEISLADLTEALDHDDPFVRMRAIAAVRDEPGVEAALVSTLDDDYPHVRREAVRALTRIGGDRATRALTHTAVADPSSEVRHEAVSALGRLVEGGPGYGEGA